MMKLGNTVRLGVFHQSLQRILEGHLSLPGLGRTSLELDPALVEAIEHLDARLGPGVPLRFEPLLPGLPGNRFHPDGAAQETCQRRANVSRADAVRSLELDDSLPAPALLEQ